MSLFIRTVIIGIFSILIISFETVLAGPPFFTDDPEPVDFHHWEFYIASTDTYQSGHFSGTLPHIELNYGFIPDMQAHLLLPMDFDLSNGKRFIYGYGYTEAGIKYRFVHETNNTPQIGVFPLVEIPTFSNPAFGNEQIQVYLPVWIQKSWNRLTTYGGAGYWINPGNGNKNWLFTGWEVQYNLFPQLSFGGEIYYQTSRSNDTPSVVGFNIGGSFNPTHKFHVIFSGGHALNENVNTMYLGLLWTI